MGVEFAQIISTLDQRPETTEPVPIFMDQNDAISGIEHSVGHPADIRISESGTYVLIAAPQVGRKTGKGCSAIDFWLRRNNRDIPNSNVRCVIETNEKNIISLKIYENTSPEYLSHVEIHFNPHDKVVGGVSIEEPIVSIVWDDTGGEVIQGVYGNEEMITNISIEQEIKNSLAIVTFEFEFTQPLDTSTLMVKIWDEERTLPRIISMTQ